LAIPPAVSHDDDKIRPTEGTGVMSCPHLTRWL
jgi:hypothetical protein